MRLLGRTRLAESARHAVYGSVIVLAVIIALDDTSVSPREATASVIGAAIATVLAEVYADYLASTIRDARKPTPAERREAARNALSGLIAAILPVIFFVLAGAGVLSTHHAFNAAVWTGVGVVGAYAFVANRVAGMTTWQSVLAGAGFTVLGALLVLLKALVSH